MRVTDLETPIPVIDLDRVEHGAADRGTVDIDRWVTFMRAELAWRAGDFASAARCCAGVLAAIAGHRAVWWESLRAPGSDAVLEQGMTLHLELPSEIEIRGEVRHVGALVAGQRRYGVRFHKIGHYTNN